jgi:A/G-specific adenine glycosylase
VLKPKKISPQYVHAAGVIIQRGRVLLAQRPADGLLGGMWEFPNGRVNADPAKELTKVLNAAYRLKIKRKEALGIIQHAYTHFKVTEHVFLCDSTPIPKNRNLKWVRLAELDDYPMGKVDRQIAQKIK